jgi:PAP2 superfamily protein
MQLRSLLLAAAVAAGPAPVLADSVLDSSPNPVVEWATIVQQAITGPAAPRSAGTSEILHTMVHLAVYDAVVAIEGGSRPFATKIRVTGDADVRAAIATAAYRTARPRLAAANLPAFDQAYATYMAGLPEADEVAEGIRVGTAAADAMLALRATDGFVNVVPYACSAVPAPIGEFEPDAGCPAAPASAQPVDAKVGGITPFTLRKASALRPRGPLPLESRLYAKEFAETRDYGRADSTVRSAEQTDIAYFWAENPYVHWNRNLTALAVAKGLDVPQTARFFAMVHTAASDAVIAGFEAKYVYRAWRPRTAIPRGDDDGNLETIGDPTWRPLLSVNHPEYPSGHGFWSTAVIGSVAAFFGTTRVEWTLTTSKTAVPALVKTERTYPNLVMLLGQIGDARVWGGLHWRHAIRDGAGIGGRVAAHVCTQFFQPTRRGR